MGQHPKRRTINASDDDILAGFHRVFLAQLANGPGHVAALASALARDVRRVNREVNGAELLDELLHQSHGLQLHVVLTRFHGQINLLLRLSASYCSLTKIPAQWMGVRKIAQRDSKSERHGLLIKSYRLPPAIGANSVSEAQHSRHSCCGLEGGSPGPPMSPSGCPTPPCSSG